MFEFVASTVVKRPIGEVFAFFADAENDRRWRSGIVELRRVKGGPGEVGARYRQQVNPMGKTVDADIEITTVDPGRRIGWTTTTRNAVRPDGEYRFEEAGPGATRVTLTMTVHVEGMAMKLLQPVMRSGMQKGFAADFEKLRLHLEAAGGTDRTA